MKKIKEFIEKILDFVKNNNEYSVDILGDFKKTKRSDARNIMRQHILAVAKKICPCSKSMLAKKITGGRQQRFETINALIADGSLALSAGQVFLHQKKAMNYFDALAQCFYDIGFLLRYGIITKEATIAQTKLDKRWRRVKSKYSVTGELWFPPPGGLGFFCSLVNAQEYQRYKELKHIEYQFYCGIPLNKILNELENMWDNWPIEWGERPITWYRQGRDYWKSELSLP